MSLRQPLPILFVVAAVLLIVVGAQLRPVLDLWLPSHSLRPRHSCGEYFVLNPPGGYTYHLFPTGVVACEDHGFLGVDTVEGSGLWQMADQNVCMVTFLRRDAAGTQHFGSFYFRTDLDRSDAAQFVTLEDARKASPASK